MRRIFKNARIVDVIGQRVFKGWFSVVDGNFELVEEGKTFQKGVDLSGTFVVPCLIDTHMHVESSFLTPARFAEKALVHGTCVALQDPHEMANVFGKRGVQAMIESARKLPLRFYAAIPSCVPATRPPLDTPNAWLSVGDMEELLRMPDVKALGEVMDYRGLIGGNEHLVKIVKMARKMGKSVEGHCPDLRGEELSIYISLGVRSDHTLMTPEKILEELSKGMYVMIQEKSLNPENVETITSLQDRSRVLLVTDDVPASKLVRGHLNRVVEKAIEYGWPPIDAIASATIRPAVYLGLDDTGCICPGKRVSFFLSESLEKPEPYEVYVDGEIFDGNIDDEFEWSGFTSVELPELSLGDFLFNLKDSSHEFRVVTANTENTHTRIEVRKLRVKNGFPVLENDLIAVGVFRRSGGGSLGLLGGFELRSDVALASSFSHDSHNIIVLGRSPSSMVKVYERLRAIGGGMVLLSGERTVEIPLEIGGIITNKPADKIAARLEDLENTLKSAGFAHRNPVVFITVLALTVSPEYKFSDLGIVDVRQRRVISPVIR